VSHKEASGVAALVGAVDLVREARASAVITGGVDATFPTFFKVHDRFKVMSAEPAFSRRLAPFDAERAGFVLGEGAFAFWVEADGSGRPSHGEILGVSASSAAVGVNLWPDHPEPLARTMRQAIEDAGLAPRDVDVVYASANATSLDGVEARAITAVFAGLSPVVTSIKGAIGEFGAAGSAACAAALLCGAEGKVPPIAGLCEADAAAAPLRLAREVTEAPGRIALVNGVASGGALFSLVLRASPSRQA
jgi:3-oxoacyl-(acyl-carrier-protein) synthase